jgi:hypothetical protein
LVGEEAGYEDHHCAKDEKNFGHGKGEGLGKVSGD